MRLYGKTALITGAARGIGFEFARAYIAEGATVALADVNAAALAKAVADLGPKAVAVQMDVTSQTSIASAADSIAFCTLSPRLRLWKTRSVMLPSIDVRSRGRKAYRPPLRSTHSRSTAPATATREYPRPHCRGCSASCGAG